jgi:hypothetical protein
MVITGLSAMAFAAGDHVAATAGSRGHINQGFMELITRDLSGRAPKLVGHSSNGYDGMDRSPHGTC